ncbi:MAG: porphobilinogen synthase [Bacillota bacterium]|nr:porphobilinogen synthase [Bacillota bacterium]
MDLVKRGRRLRRSPGIRKLVRETVLNVEDLIYPIFVMEGTGVKKEMTSLQGQYYYSLDTLEEEIRELESLGINSIILFGLPDEKDEAGSEAYSENGIVQRAIRKIKEISPELVVITDVCLCQYTSHGHCGVLHNHYIDNDKSAELIAKTALSHAKAGADIVAPSDMMDGRIKAIRTLLDKEGYEDIAIMSYSVKYASAFYGPFRDVAHSAPSFGDRKTYQMDSGNALEALREAEQDIEEGADFLMVKPAMAYQDVIYRLKENFPYPLAAYNVSGEYCMIKAAASQNLIDEKAVVMEMLLGLKRSGADIIITYFAKDAARYLRGE